MNKESIAFCNDALISGFTLGSGSFFLLRMSMIRDWISSCFAFVAASNGGPMGGVMRLAFKKMKDNVNHVCTLRNVSMNEINLRECYLHIRSST